MKKLKYFKERIYIQTNAKNCFVSLIFVQTFTYLCKRFSSVFPSAELKFALLLSKYFTYTEPPNSQRNSKHNNSNSKKSQKLKKLNAVKLLWQSTSVYSNFANKGYFIQLFFNNSISCWKSEKNIQTQSFFWYWASMDQLIHLLHMTIWSPIQLLVKYPF